MGNNSSNTHNMCVFLYVWSVMAPLTNPAIIIKGVLSKSIYVGTRKMVNYAWGGWSQGKLWWKSAAILTCKSFVKPVYRGERLIEPFGSWFPPKFPSGLLRLSKRKQLYQVKRMIRSIRDVLSLTYSQTLNGYDNLAA